MREIEFTAWIACGTFASELARGSSNAVNIPALSGSRDEETVYQTLWNYTNVNNLICL